ncbi:hypothetical protein HPB47_005860 [Ixodes persulcatus]|uniref:Uncharacterized protein n=1 Tax=Ixodes persulcatus TaxID=34615 RepID=A0AC60PCP6_IXOPE|nr:hypothetical protein HPB47_005860 [Ixodes persulcatus]
MRFTLQQHGEMLNKHCAILLVYAVIAHPSLVEQAFNTLPDLLAFEKELDEEKAPRLVDLGQGIHVTANAWSTVYKSKQNSIWVKELAVAMFEDRVLFESCVLGWLLQPQTPRSMSDCR